MIRTGFLFVVFLLTVAACTTTHAQIPQTGQFCFEFQWPTETIDGQDASVVGVSKVYFELLPDGASEALSTVIENPAITSHCFENVPVGSARFAYRAYDSLQCAGEDSLIETHEVFPTRPRLKPPVVQVQITGSQPETPSDDCDADPNCERRQ